MKDVSSFSSIKWVQNYEYIPHAMKNHVVPTGNLYLFSGMVAPLSSGLVLVAVHGKVVQLAHAVVFTLTLVE